jgi:hypothetical protein
MKSKVFVIGLLAFTLFAFMVPENAFAQKKQKLGEKAAEELMKKIDKLSPNVKNDAQEAIKIIKRYAEDAKKNTGLGFTWPQGMAAGVKSRKLKDIFNLIDSGVDILEKVENVATAIQLTYRWNSGKETKYAKDAANLMFDTLDFASGFFIGGAYYKYAINQAKATMQIVYEYYANQKWTEFYASPGSIMNQAALARPRTGSWYTNDAYYDFAKAWFLAAYDPKMSDSLARGILLNISEYIWAMETLKNAGLL